MNELIRKLAKKTERLKQLNDIFLPQVAQYLNEAREENERENTPGCYGAHYILCKKMFDDYQEEETLTRYAIRELNKEIKAAKFKALQEENPSRIHFIELYLKEHFTYQEFMSANIQQLAKGGLYSYLVDRGSISPEDDKNKIAESIRTQLLRIKNKKKMTW